MRKSVFLSLVISIFFSCEKVSDTVLCPQPIGGKIIVGDSTFSLQPTVVVTNMGTNTNGFFHASTSGLLYLVNLIDSRVILSSDPSNFETPMNIRVPIITIPCYTSNPDSLPVGTYTFSKTQPFQINSFSPSLVTYYRPTGQGGTINYSYPEVDSGSIVISHICDNQYNISLNAKLSNGGRYQGTLNTEIVYIK